MQLTAFDNAIAEGWVRSVRSECLDHLIVFNEANFVEFYPRTSPITIAGAPTARCARQFHAARQGPSLGKHAERSSRNLCLAGYTTFTALLHDKFLRPTAIGYRLRYICLPDETEGSDDG